MSLMWQQVDSRALKVTLPGSVASRFVVSLAREVASRSATAGSESSVLRFQREEHRDERRGQDERG